MAAKRKIKDNKPIIKVEEIEEDSPNTNASGQKAADKEIAENQNAEPSMPVVSSFSQLNSAPPPTPDVPVNNKAKTGSYQTMENETLSADTPTDKGVLKNKGASEQEQVSSDEVKEWLKDVRPDTTKEIEKGRGPSGKVIILIVILLVIVGSVVGGVLYFQKGISESTQVEPTPTQAPVQTATPTPEAETVDKTNISVNVLNGSGIAGEAGKVKEMLIEAGFSEDNVSIGNAASYDFENVTVSLKEGASNALYDEIEGALTGSYEVSLSDEALDKDTNYEAVLTVGK